MNLVQEVGINGICDMRRLKYGQSPLLLRLNGSVEVNFIEMMKFEQRKEGGKGVICGSGEKAFQEEGTASAKALG